MELLYLVTPLLLILVVLAAVWLDRWSVPVIVVALGVGILFGSDVLQLVHFDDARLTNHVANLALVFILFHGGFDTRREDFRAVALPAGGLATWGVILTALFSFILFWKGFKWDFKPALLLSVIISSTDAAAIFSIMRRHSLPRSIS
ncbi:MAG: cation:proton antiporter, partial [Kiritimatiellia bacterium]